MIRVVLLWFLLATGAFAQVQVDSARSHIRDGWWKLDIALGLSDVTPFRVFTLDAPRRLVIDLANVDWPDIATSDLLERGRATGLRTTALGDGWTRLVIDLAEPMVLSAARMSAGDAAVSLRITLAQATAQEFATKAGAPPGVGFDGVVDGSVRDSPTNGPLVVMIDPGHGGLDPGAQRDGLLEADLMLALARDVMRGLSQVAGVKAVMTRDSDQFVPLAQRVSMARAAGADLLISLHADALDVDEAQGASVYTLTIDGGDAAATRMLERHAQGDLLSGIDLRGQGDRVATVLMDLARQETAPQSRAFADLLVQQMQGRGVRLNARPRREGQLAVLAAADFQSVLIEAGFLSNAADRARLRTPQGRAPLVAAIVAAVSIWGVD
ncbi:N-acetylmuramoyl-L-alanine amidase [Yoonia sediminilitoris]|uniref:N-acetylmuramoyl-L-alanine amidase n=1 Tax=Yoonia sediminilitoris TaxID=1286148 RepID=A0A2T6KRD3_9RHOB|nr:N-acetylmuramoyl-L-alanine amidase [Yoonia sediminilitoris]PUB19121.1 N-acetylmuramoyl-L-alanine amidase [Yoonia sediminilitoris]RCW99289.1 N-acetylmuramoyl-L-alanine amidase [Yoonia sediminilitoris]